MNPCIDTFALAKARETFELLKNATGGDCQALAIIQVAIREAYLSGLQSGEARK